MAPRARARSGSPGPRAMLSFLNLSALSTGSTITLVCATLTLVFMLQGWLFTFETPGDDVSSAGFVAATRRRLREEYVSSEEVFMPEDWGSFHERHAAEIRELERSFQRLQNGDHREMSEGEMAAMQLAGEIVFPGGASLGEEDPPARVQTHADEVLKKLRAEEESKNEELTRKAEKLMAVKQIQKNRKKSSGRGKGGKKSQAKKRGGGKGKGHPGERKGVDLKGATDKNVGEAATDRTETVSEKHEKPQQINVEQSGQLKLEAGRAEVGKEADAGGATGAKGLQPTERPKVMILTANEPRDCKLARGFEIIMKGVKNKIDYARLHGYELFYSMELFDSSFDIYWLKYPLLQRNMADRPDVEWFLWLDTDTLVTDLSFEIPFDKYRGFDMVFSGNEQKVYEEGDWLGLNAGGFLVRNSHRGRAFVDAVMEYGALDKRVEVGKMLSREIQGRVQDWPADDQCAIVHLLKTRQAEWRNWTVLEPDGVYHTWWKTVRPILDILADQGNDIDGGAAYPFVTHFTGCKMCQGEYGESSLAECHEAFDRAYNFADNQVLRTYGYQHTSLESAQLRPL